MSPASVATVSNCGDAPAIASPKVVAASIGDGAAGSAVIRKKFSQPEASRYPAHPSAPMGISALPSKQK